MSNTLTEDGVNGITDLFEACELLEKYALDLDGVVSVDDAKCRLLRHVQEVRGTGFTINASDLMQNVLDGDHQRRKELTEFYLAASDVLGILPKSRQEELNKHVNHYVEGLSHHLERIQKSDCAILIAGEVSAGKSSLLNLLVSQDLFPTSLLNCTSVMCELRYSSSRYAIVHSGDPLQSPKTISLEKQSAPDKVLAPFIHCATNRANKVPICSKIEVYWPLSLLKGGIVIVDSPGIGENNEITEMVKNYLTSAFAFIYVINSSNAGGLQPDRLQELLAALVEKRQEDDMSVFDPSAAVFVANKWDQIPNDERGMVKKDTLEKLRKCWPGLNDNQLYCMSTKQAARSLIECSFVTSEYAELLKGIQELLPISLQSKQEHHYRWLSQVLKRSAFVLRVHMANETRSDAERHELMRKLKDQVEKLREESCKIRLDLRAQVHKHTEKVCDQLVAHLASASTHSRLLTWEPIACPDGDDWFSLEELLVAKVHKRIRKEVSDWDIKNRVFSDIHKELMQHFQERFHLMEDQLGALEGHMIGTGRGTYDTLVLRKSLRKQVSLQTPVFSWTQKMAIGLAAPVLLPLGVIAGVLLLPVAGFRAVRDRFDDVRQLNEYRVNKADTLANMTDVILEDFLKKENLNKLIQDQLKVVKRNVETMIDTIPKLIEADHEMIGKLTTEGRSMELSINHNYRPLYQKLVSLQGKLDLFYALKVRKYEASIEDLVWDPMSPPVASGSFSDVYKAKWKLKSIAMKIPRETLSETSVSEVLMEEEVFRRLRHKHIVQYLGTVLRTGECGHQLILLMECCQKTLKSRIPSDEPPNPGKLSPEHPVRRRSITMVAQYGRQIAEALVYLHTRNFVHRDLKPQNILLTEGDDIKLTDVGQTRRESEISGTRCGTGCYSAPEVLAGLTHSCSADVFSLGIFLWELWYGKTAQSDIEMTIFGATKTECRNSATVDAEFAVLKGTRPCLANVHVPPEEWKDLLRRLWHHDPAERPTANECVKFFSKLSPCYRY